MRQIRSLKDMRSCEKPNCPFTGALLESSPQSAGTGNAGLACALRKLAIMGKRMLCASLGREGAWQTAKRSPGMVAQPCKASAGAAEAGELLHCMVKPH